MYLFTWFIWSQRRSYLGPRCERNCLLDPNAASLTVTDDGAGCFCTSDLIWNPCTTRCQRNCSYEADPNSIRANSADPSACDCRKNYIWDPSTIKCQPTPAAYTCLCPDGLIWNSATLSCIRDCSLDPYAAGLNLDNKQQCLCKISFWKSYVWSNTYKKCVPYCGLGFSWNDVSKTCVFSLLGASPDEVPMQEQPTQIANQRMEESNQESSRKTIAIIVLECLTGILAITVIGLLFYVYKRRNAKQSGHNDQKQVVLGSSKSLTEVGEAK